MGLGSPNDDMLDAKVRLTAMEKFSFEMLYNFWYQFTIVDQLGKRNGLMCSVKI